MSNQLASTTTRFTTKFLPTNFAMSAIPHQPTPNILAERIQIVPHIQGQCPLPLGSVTSISASSAQGRAPSGFGHHTGWLRVGATIKQGVAIGLTGIIFIIGNESIVT
jgi:hypothetical protein